MFGPYGYNGSSYFNLVETQTAHIVRCLRHARQGGATSVEVRPAAVERPFAEVVRATRDALAAQGFGVLTEIDMQATLKAKIGADIAPQVILGACRPPLAHAAILAEPSIGLLLPCNVVVQDIGGGRTEVAAIDPVASMQAIANPRLKQAAEQVGAKLKKVIENL